MDRGQRRVPGREQELKRTVHAPRRRVPFAGPVLLFLLLVSGSSTPPRQHIADAVRRFLAGRPDSPIVIDGLITASPAQLRLFYGERRYEPVWMTEGGRALIPGLVHAIRSAEEQGLDPVAYRLSAIEARVAAIAAGGDDARAIAATELLLSDAYLTLAAHRAIGRVDPRRIHSQWTLSRPAFDAVASLREAVGGLGIARALEAADPADSSFRALRDALRQYRIFAAATPWPRIMSGSSLREGDRDPRVIAIRERLVAESAAATGMPAEARGATDTLAWLFDAALAAQVRAFQERNGLDPDGVVGPVTREALNIPAAARVTQIALNLERLRWLPALEDPRIEILIPDFSLRVVQQGHDTLVMRVIAGRPDWPTPVFSAVITGVVLNPYWNVPDRILAREVIPAVLRDRRYLDRNDMEILTPSGTIVPPSTIDWASVSPATFPYRIRQRPGPRNPLGRVKFVLAPRHLEVFLHDTPFRQLFRQANRALSHGCVRLASPLDLARLVLEREPRWTPDRVAAALSTNRETTIDVRSGLPVHFVYRTAWVDAAGHTQFRPDVYELDASLRRTLAGARAAMARYSLLDDDRAAHEGVWIAVIREAARLAERPAVDSAGRGERGRPDSCIRR